MSIAAFAVSQAAVSQAQAVGNTAKTPPPRLVIVVADTKAAPEAR